MKFREAKKIFLAAAASFTVAAFAQTGSGGSMNAPAIPPPGDPMRSMVPTPRGPKKSSRRRSRSVPPAPPTSPTAPRDPTDANAGSNASSGVR